MSANNQRVVTTDWLKQLHRDLDACQKVIWLGLDGADPSYCRDAQARLKEIDALLAQPEQATPAAKWRENGEPDPHGDHYNCERAALSMGDMTDDELANAVFMHGNERPSLAEMMAGKPMPIAYLTAAKERIRWLSRKLVEAQRGATTGEQQ